MSKLAKFRRRHPKKSGAPKRNPPLATDLVAQIIPGFAAFAATRFVTRVAALQIAKRWPKHAKHAGAMASLGTFAAAWFGGHRVKMLEKYHDMIVVGAGVAAIQSLVQLYLPSVGWMVSDCSPELHAGAHPKQLTAASLLPHSAAAAEAAAAPLPQGFRETSANEWFSYNDSYDAGIHKGQTPAPDPSPLTSAFPDDQQIDELLSGDDDGIGDSSGIFSAGGN